MDLVVADSTQTAAQSLDLYSIVIFCTLLSIAWLLFRPRESINVRINTEELSTVKKRIKRLEADADDQAHKVKSLTRLADVKTAHVDTLTKQNYAILLQYQTAVTELKASKAVLCSPLSPLAEKEIDMIHDEHTRLLEHRIDGVLYSRSNVTVSTEDVKKMMENADHLTQLRMHNLGEDTARRLIECGIRSHAHLRAKYMAMKNMAVSKEDHYDLFYAFLAGCKIGRPCIMFMVAYYTNMYNEQQ
eukprot:3228-Heterococcus_DN1.PRE.2